MSKKTIFIIPGFKHTPRQNAYKTIAKTLKKQGYFPIIVPIQWKNTTVSQNTEVFLQQFKKLRRKEKYILGFSFGAMIALLAATKVSVSGLILCSLSPYFQEDLKKMPELIASLGIQRYEDFIKLKSGHIAHQVKAKKTVFLYGAKEEKAVIHRVKKTYAAISSKRKYLLPIEKTDHDITHPHYIDSIHQAAQYFQ